MGQVKFDATQDLQKVAGEEFSYKGDMMTGSHTYKVGKSSSIRCGQFVDIPGTSPINPLKGLN